MVIMLLVQAGHRTWNHFIIVVSSVLDYNYKKAFR